MQSKLLHYTSKAGGFLNINKNNVAFFVVQFKYLLYICGVVQIKLVDGKREMG